MKNEYEVFIINDADSISCEKVGSLGVMEIDGEPFIGGGFYVQFNVPSKVRIFSKVVDVDEGSNPKRVVIRAIASMNLN